MALRPTKGTSRASRPRKSASKSKSAPKAGAKAKSGARNAKPVMVRQGEKVVLLSGGNPQIAKADGDAPVQAYIAAMPGWKRDLGKRLDALIVRNVPNVRKVAFFRGTSLRPVPPGASKSKDTRYVDMHEGAELDEAQMATWVRQAAALPGWIP